MVAIQLFLEKLVQLGMSIVRLLLTSSFMVRLPRDKDKEECIIMGNGPSLNSLINNNPEFLADKELIVVNFFANSERYIELKPKYYVLNPIEFWMDNVDDKRKEMRVLLFNNIIEKTTWKINLFIPYAAKKYQHWKPLLQNQKYLNIVYFNQTPVEGFKWFNHFCFKRNLGMPRPHNVLIPCLIFGINMGFSKIYLWGADHSWLNTIWVNEKNQALLVQKHFYDKGEVESAGMKTTKIDEIRPLHMILHKFMLTFRGYFEILEYSKKTNTLILNATPNSYIDAFDRFKM